MSTLKELLISGVPPSAALRQVYGDLGSKEIVLRIDQDLDGIPTAVLHAIANWNRNQVVGREHMGLTDAQFDGAVAAALCEKLKLLSQ